MTISVRKDSLAIVSLIALLGLHVPNSAIMPTTNSFSSSILQNLISTKTILALTSASILASTAWYLFFKQPNHSSYYWNWDTIDTDETEFPANFVWGVGTSAHQVEGNCTNNTWSEWEKSTDDNGNPRVKEPSGIACDHWNRYKEDVRLMKELGIDVYRFSIEWSKIEPKEGTFDEEALAHYEDLCNELLANGIKPFIGFHHNTDPLWFAKKGGFEKEENIAYFVHFCSIVFDRLKDKGYLWCTFNSPSGYAAKGYLIGTAPPGKKNMQSALEVLKNILEAHVQVYQKLKIIKPTAQIGMLKNIYQLDPWLSWNPLDRLACSIGNLLTNKTIYEFFTKGSFKVHIPFKVYINHNNKNAPQSLDFIGLSYYSHAFMQNFKTTLSPHEFLTDNPNYTIYPEGLYRAIQEISHALAKPLDIPIYIAENGIATTDDTIRDLFLRRYLYVINKAIKDGYDIQGYIHWSLLDNYEWGTYDKKFGIWAVDRITLERTLKPGAQYFIDTIQASKTRTS